MLNTRRVVAAAALLCIGSVPAPVQAQDWCSDAARKQCGVGSFQYTGTFNGTITVTAKMTTGEDYSTATEYTITIADKTATCTGNATWTGGGQTIGGAAEVIIWMDELLEGRHAGPYIISARCQEFDRDSELVSIEKSTTDYNSLVGEMTIPHPETDPDNGVSGTLTVKWNLKGTAKPRS